MDQIERARKVVPIVSVQNRYNVTDRKLDHPTLHTVAARHRATVFQIGLAWLLARSPAMLVIPGTSSVEHLEENVAAAEIRLTRRDMKELDSLRN